jgi:sorbitol-specific phosphotransferase system component IIA
LSETRAGKLREEHRAKVERVRKDESLSFERQQLAIRLLGLQLDRQLKELGHRGR